MGGREDLDLARCTDYFVCRTGASCRHRSVTVMPVNRLPNDQSFEIAPPKKNIFFVFFRLNQPLQDAQHVSAGFKEVSLSPSGQAFQLHGGSFTGLPEDLAHNFRRFTRPTWAGGLEYRGAL